MNAFYEAIERIDEIKVDEILREPLLEVLNIWAKYVDEHPNLKLDFNQLFRNYLYNNLTIKLNEKVFIDDTEVAGAYYSVANEIQVSNIEKMHTHTLMHEFTHFVYHNSHKNLPTWADEMLTESFTINQMGKSFGSYAKLINLCKLLDKNLQKIDFEQFLNGEFDSYITENNLDDIAPQLQSLLKKTTKDQYNDIMTSIVLGKASNLLSQSLPFKDYITEMANTDLSGLNFDGKLFVDRLTIGATQYVNRTQYVPTDFMKIRPFIEKIYIINSLQKEYNGKIDSIQIGKINGTPMLLCAGEKRVVCWYDYPSKVLVDFGKGRFGKIEIRENGFGVTESKSLDGETAIEILGQKFVLNEKENIFECENSEIKFEKVDGTIQENIQALADVFNLAIYKKDKQDFVSKAGNGRVCAFNDNKEFDLKMRDLRRLSIALGAPVYACKQSLYTTGGDNGCIVGMPLYCKHDENTVVTKINKISKENISLILEQQDVQFGEQFDIVAKVGDDYVTIANVIKGCEQDDFSLSVNYSAALKQLVPEHADAVLSEFVPIEKSNLIKIDECYDKPPERINE